MFNSGDYESDVVKKMMAYCEQNVWPGTSGRGRLWGQFHYTHYYSQVMYQQGKKDWARYFNNIGAEILRTQSADGSWKAGHIGPIYATSINTTILQLGNNYLPIYQR